MRPAFQVFDGLARQVLFVQLSVDLRQLGHPEPITVLPKDLFDANLNLLRVVRLPFPRAGALVQVGGSWGIEINGTLKKWKRKKR